MHIKVKNRFAALEKVDQELISGKVVRDAAPGRDWGWRQVKPRRWWSRKVKPAVLPPQPPTAKVALISELTKERLYTIPLCTLEYDLDRGWVEQPARGSPRLPVELSLYERAYMELDRPEPVSQVHGRPIKRTVRQAVADTGVQVNILDAKTVRAWGWT